MIQRICNPDGRLSPLVHRSFGHRDLADIPDLEPYDCYDFQLVVRAGQLPQLDPLEFAVTLRRYFSFDALVAASTQLAKYSERTVWGACCRSRLRVERRSAKIYHNRKNRTLAAAS